MTNDQANMLLDSYFNLRTRRVEVYRSDAPKHIRDEATEDYHRILTKLVEYLRPMEFRA